MILGFLMEQEFSFWSKEAVMKTEGFFPYEETEKRLYLSPDMEEGVKKENEMAMEETREELWLQEETGAILVNKKHLFFSFFINSLTLTSLCSIHNINNYHNYLLYISIFHQCLFYPDYFF